jgi:glycosyltransferase involved in cell wall biosynthesis
MFGLRNLVAYAFTLPVTVWRIIRILKDYRVAVINVHYPTMTALTFIILKRIGFFTGTIITSFHGSDARWGLSLGGLRRSVWVSLLGRSDKIVAVSQQLADSIVIKYPELLTKLCVIRNGVDIALFKGVRRKERFAGEDVLIISIASFDLVKGIDVLLQAFASLRNERSNLRLLIVGESGRDDEFLHGLSRKLDLTEYVDWRCNVAHAEIPGLLARADIFVLPSRSEGFGLVLLEAGAIGLPVIATRVGGTPELIIDGHNGLLVDSEDPQAMSRAILWILDNRGLASEMGERLYQSVCDRFTWKAVYQRYEEIAASGGHN